MHTCSDQPHIYIYVYVPLIHKRTLIMVITHAANRGSAFLTAEEAKKEKNAKFEAKNSQRFVSRLHVCMRTFSVNSHAEMSIHSVYMCIRTRKTEAKSSPRLFFFCNVCMYPLCVCNHPCMYVWRKTRQT